MESESSVILESCEEDSILIETVKNMVNEHTTAELESEDEGYFVVTDVQDEQQNEIEALNEESTITQSIEQFSWSNLCRVCANANDHLIPIFDGEGLQHDLCNKIHKYLPIHVCIYILSRVCYNGPEQLDSQSFFTGVRKRYASLTIMLPLCRNDTCVARIAGWMPKC